MQTRVHVLERCCEFCFLQARFQVPVRFWPLDPVTAKSLSDLGSGFSYMEAGIAMA